ncbi:hypothetical protein IQ266_00945 [filamentous cyanobacterium LEGE 11480]|uniref:Polysaccharide lyase 14 domain-containing protein n=1 Tax=Romeriopsis navalis LEGE 11480 TaxID=2777977 RepID=A0A928Z1S7_9CYAN|nr:hypothetical protein [Romeriopsis navalis]MBE9028322.1 hypothetical protein [Romeriopsis navalis LEGE 11480]
MTLRLGLGLLLLLTLEGCKSSNSASLLAGPKIWQSDRQAKSELLNWQAHWQVRPRGQWGAQNLQLITDPNGQYPQIWRVRYPQGSASPRVHRRKKAPLGGTQFYADLGMSPRTSARLSYAVRFAPEFDFVKGGKLPGLFGGQGRHGRRRRRRNEGFSTRLMWRRNGRGEVYAYLPTSVKYGTSLGRGKWRFHPGVWHRINQEIVLNHPDQKNGQMRVWLDGKLVLEETQLQFRTHDRLKIEGIFFSTFFGGGNASWATPKAVYIDFSDFSITAVR